MAEREHDIVLFGATGFTGGLTAEYLARQAPAGTKLALAGRNRQKLEGIRARLDRSDLPLLDADTNDPGSIDRLAASTKVAISTVGPYILYGEPLVKACAENGTAYVDLTGEPEFVDLMWLRYHEQAQRSGARIVHSCGFDSIPYDLGALFTVNQLPEGVPLKLECFVRAAATFSGGTYHSAINGFARARQTMRNAADRRRREQRPQGRRVKGVMKPPHRVSELGAWAVPFPSIDPQTVLRSARALDRYGPDFSYGHYILIKRAATVAGLIAGTGALIGLAQVPPARKALLRFKDPGEGPSPEQRAKSWFQVTISGEAPGRKVTSEITGGDPGYGETSKMLAEAGLCLALDELPDRAGQLTPAVAMGEALIERLQRAGIGFRTAEP